MKLTHETLVRTNPAQILLPRFTVSQIMRNDQQVTFRIFFTANYNAFTRDDYLVVKYAQPDQDGLPITDKHGYVQYFKPPTPPDVGPIDGLVFGSLRYDPADNTYKIDWSHGTVSDEPQPADMLVPEPLEIRVRKARRRRVLKAVTPAEKALAAATLDPHSRQPSTDDASKSDDRREAEVTIMNVAIPEPECFVQTRKIQYQDSVQTYASRMADAPNTPLGTVMTCNGQTSSTDTPERQNPKEKRYKVTPRGRVVAVRSDRLNQPAPMWVTDGIKTLPPHYMGEDFSDDAILKLNDNPAIKQFNEQIEKRVEERLKFRREHWATDSETSFRPSQDSEAMQDTEPPSKDDISYSEVSLVCDASRGTVPYFKNDKEREKFFKDLAKKPGAYAELRRSFGEKIYGPLAQARYDNRAHVREILSESSLERDILIDGSVIHLPEEEETEDPTTQEGTDIIDGDDGQLEPEDEPDKAARGSQLRIVHTVEDEEVTVDDVGGAEDGDGLADGGLPDRHPEPPPDQHSEPPPDQLPDELPDQPSNDPVGPDTPNDLAPPAEDNEDDFTDIGGLPEQPPELPPEPPAAPSDPDSPNTPNDLVPPNKQDPVLDPEPAIPKRAHVRPFKSHYEPGYDPVTGDLVWKVRLGFDGAFDSFEDYVRVFTDAICRRVQEEAYMASEGRMVVDPKEVLDGLAMLAQKRLYFRSNPGYAYCYWDHCSPRLRRLFQPPHYFRDHYSRHLYWYLVCGTANCTELKDSTFRILIGRHAFVGRAEEITIASHVPITIPGNSFFNPMAIEIRDENDELYELEVPYIIEWTFTPLRPA